MAHPSIQQEVQVTHVSQLLAVQTQSRWHEANEGSKIQEKRKIKSVRYLVLDSLGTDYVHVA